MVTKTIFTFLCLTAMLAGGMGCPADLEFANPVGHNDVPGADYGADPSIDNSARAPEPDAAGSQARDQLARLASEPVTTATVGIPYVCMISAMGSPSPTVTVSGLPAWLQYDSATRKISGTPAAGNVGTTGTITLTASNGIAPNATQSFQITTTFASSGLTASYDATGNVVLSWVNVQQQVLLYREFTAGAPAASRTLLSTPDPSRTSYIDDTAVAGFHFRYIVTTADGTQFGSVSPIPATALILDCQIGDNGHSFPGTVLIDIAHGYGYRDAYEASSDYAPPIALGQPPASAAALSQHAASADAISPSPSFPIPFGSWRIEVGDSEEHDIAFPIDCGGYHAGEKLPLHHFNLRFYSADDTYRIQRVNAHIFKARDGAYYAAWIALKVGPHHAVTQRHLCIEMESGDKVDPRVWIDVIAAHVAGYTLQEFFDKLKDLKDPTISLEEVYFYSYLLAGVVAEHGTEVVVGVLGASATWVIEHADVLAGSAVAIGGVAIVVATLPEDIVAAGAGVLVRGLVVALSSTAAAAASNDGISTVPISHPSVRVVSAAVPATVGYGERYESHFWLQNEGGSGHCNYSLMSKGPSDSTWTSWQSYTHDIYVAPGAAIELTDGGRLLEEGDYHFRLEAISDSRTGSAGASVGGVVSDVREWTVHVTKPQAYIDGTVSAPSSARVGQSVAVTITYVNRGPESSLANAFYRLSRPNGNRVFARNMVDDAGVWLGPGDSRVVEFTFTPDAPGDWIIYGRSYSNSFINSEDGLADGVMSESQLEWVSVR